MPLWYLTFLGYHQQSSPVVLIPGLPCPPEGTACRDHYSLLRCVPVPLRWGLLCVPCPISTTSVYFTFSPERKIWCHIYSNLQPMKALALLLPWSFLKKKCPIKEGIFLDSTVWKLYRWYLGLQKDLFDTTLFVKHNVMGVVNLVLTLPQRLVWDYHL